PWDQHGVEVVAKASNGKEAIRLFDQMKPDIVLLDIQMPEIDGLSVAKYISEHKPQVKIIMLSGHDDFRYAQQALEYNVVKYLLKPAGAPEIIDAVLEARRLYKAEISKTYRLEQLQKKWEEHLPQLHNAFFLNWLNGQY